MALTKTKADLLGTEAAPHSVATGDTSHVGGALRDVTGKVGIMYIFKVVFGATFNGTVKPKLEIFTAGENTLGYCDTLAYETIEIAVAASGTFQVSLPIRFAENIMYTEWKLTTGSFTAGSQDIYIGVVETSL